MTDANLHKLHLNGIDFYHYSQFILLLYNLIFKKKYIMVIYKAVHIVIKFFDKNRIIQLDDFVNILLLNQIIGNK